MSVSTLILPALSAALFCKLPVDVFPVQQGAAASMQCTDVSAQSGQERAGL